MPCLTRRHLITQPAMSLAGLAAAYLLHQGRAGAAPPKPELERRSFDLEPRAAAHPPQATAMISMFMQGGPSHIDLFDPKPELNRHHLKETSEQFVQDNTEQASRKLFGSPWSFARHGECGMELSELMPHLAGIADEICLIRSMHTGNSGHEPSIAAMNTGRFLRGRPSLGSWFAYGLGSVTRDLPAFVALTDPRGLPVLGVENWSNGWLPSIYQGTVIRPKEPRIPNLDPPSALRGAPQERMLRYLSQLNAELLARHPGESDLEARSRSYELAARMQVAAREAMDLSGETEETRRLYGLDDPATQEFGSRCLVARRLVERGVRFVQVFTGNQTWDHHNGIAKLLPAAIRGVDRPAAGLVRDLKRRGLLETTLVHWGGEMGRLPVVQFEQNAGRDHNGRGFSMWLAGGGVKAGLVHGATDELGHRAVKDVVNHFDYHATLMYLFGMDPAQVSFTRPGNIGSLMDGQPGAVVSEILRRPPNREIPRPA
jgi:hypothetical protein